MSYSYEATFEYQQEDEGWLVTFSAFDGAVAFGSTIAEACDNAATVLRLFVAQWLDDGKELPEPTFHEPPQSVISVEVVDAYRVRTRCTTITGAAEELGVSTGRVSQLVTSGALDAIELDGRRYVTLASLSSHRASEPQGRGQAQAGNGFGIAGCMKAFRPYCGVANDPASLELSCKSRHGKRNVRCRRG